MYGKMVILSTFLFLNKKRREEEEKRSNKTSFNPIFLFLANMFTNIITTWGMGMGYLVAVFKTS